MSEALVKRTNRDPIHASGRLRRAAEHYVRGGCKSVAPSLRWAGYAETTARAPAQNGLGHDRLVQVAAYWSKGAKATAKSYVENAIKTLADMMEDTSQGGAVRGSAAKTILDVGMKEKENENAHEIAEEEQAKWMSLIRHWKRTFLRRGILIGMDTGCRGENCHCPECECVCDTNELRGGRPRRVKLLAELNFVLGKGPRPEWMGAEDGEGILGPEGDTRHGAHIEAEVVEEARPDCGESPAGTSGGLADTAETESGSGPTDPE